MTTPQDITVSLDMAKALARAGWPQDLPSFVWVEAGQKYGDGYGNTASNLTEECLYFVGGPAAELREGNRSSGGHDYRGDIKFSAVCVGEYGDDNYFEYPVSCAAPTAEEILRRLPQSLVNQYDNDALLTICIRPDIVFWEINFIDADCRTLWIDDQQITARSVSLANAAASMFCFLVEQKLLP